MKNNDVKVTYYNTGKDHPVAIIRFSAGLDSMLETDRVFLRFDAQRLYFEKANPGHGLSLNFSKIQIWKLASSFEQWVGAYPLRFDVVRCSYFIDLCDKIEIEQNDGSKIGNSVQYTKHFGCTRKKSNDKIKETVEKHTQKELEAEQQVKVEQKVEIQEEVKAQPKNITTPEKALTLMLLDKSIDQLENGNYEDAKAVMVTLRMLMNE